LELKKVANGEISTPLAKFPSKLQQAAPLAKSAAWQTFHFADSEVVWKILDSSLYATITHAFSIADSSNLLEHHYTT
jgi:hypothetical protein